MDQQSDVTGKKIFLLYPHSVIRDEMLDVLIMAGYETYTLVDEVKARKLLIKFPGSIMFINIDEGLKEKEWDAYIRDIQKDPQTKSSRLGIMSYNQDRDLMQKYLMDLAIPCGYVQLKLGLQESTRIILSVLDANEARGRRKSIRADCHDDISSSVNYKGDSALYHGSILDISSAGIAAKFDKFVTLPASSLLKDVQLKLRTGLVMTDMVLMGQRQDDKHIYILLFDAKLSTENKLTIHRYIKQLLQKYIDTLKV
ncbi:MAG: PilZ domain-containing protein [Treponema sp.]|nr:PilZ domain-containing protein [Treponema sp.]